MKKILLIEDDKPTIEIYEEVLKRGGFEVETLKTGFEAIERLEEIKKGKKEKPDLILLDLILPGFDGIEILEKAKGEEKIKNLSFFILTNYTAPEAEKRVKELGIENYIVKANTPPSQLVKIIKDWFKKRMS